MKYKTKQEIEQGDVFGVGAPNDAFAKYFSGASFLNPLVDPKESPVFLANITFEPGCRNNWHIHHADKGGGQILVCTSGQGVYQEWGEVPQILNPGDVVYIKPGIKHFHGAVADSWFSHIAVECPGENCSNEWCEPVSDEEYSKIKA